MECSVGSNVSYVWRSILCGLELIHVGVYKRIGDSKSIHPFLDSWLPRPSSFRPLTQFQNTSPYWRVLDFIIGGQWNLPFVQQIFLLVDVELIKCIPISSSNRPGQWCWFYDNSGNDSVKSSYKLVRTLFVDCG